MQTKGLLLAAQYVVLAAAYGQNVWAPRQDQGEIVSQNWNNFTNTTTSSSSSTTTTTTTTSSTTSSTSSTTSTTTLTTLVTTTSDEKTTDSSSTTTDSTTTDSTTNSTTSLSSTTTTTPSSIRTTPFSIASNATTTGSGRASPSAGFSLTRLNATALSVPLSTGGLFSSTANSTASRNQTTTTTPAVLPTTSGSLFNTTARLNSSSTATNTTTATRCGIAGSFVTPPSHATKADSIDECASACRARGALCKAFEAGTVDGDGNNCWLFEQSLSDMEIGGAEDGFSWTFYDRDCDVTSRCNLQGSFITKPIESLRLDTLGDCQQACLKNSACQTFEAGSLDGNSHNCWLFDTPITSLNIGGAYTGWQWSFFDRNCELAP